MTVTTDSQNAGLITAPNQDRNPVDSATLGLLNDWRVQDATNDPPELAAAERDLSEFRKTLDGNRIGTGSLPLFRP